MRLGCLKLIQKQVSGNILFSEVDITYSMLMFQIFIRISLLKIKKIKLY
jgi:hypothetical protein